MMTAEEARNYTKVFTPDPKDIEEIERQIKSGAKHVQLYTTFFVRSYSENLAEYCRQHGYTNARIVDIYNQMTGARGGNYLAIDL